MWWVDSIPPFGRSPSHALAHNGGAHDPRYDISILTGRLRSAELNRVCEDLIARHDGVLLCGMQLALVLTSLALSLLALLASNASDAITPLSTVHVMAAVTPMVTGAARFAAAGLYGARRCSRGTLDWAVLLDVLVRAVQRQAFLIPIARASGNVHAELGGVLELALAPLEVGLCARYSLVHSALAVVLLGQLGSLGIELSAGDGAWAEEPRSAYLLAPGLRAELPVMLCALLSVPALLHAELVRRAGFMHALWLQALRAEVSHFGLNHLYHASSELDNLAEHARSSPPTQWLVPRVEIAGEQVEQVAQMLKLIVDDANELSDAKAALTSPVSLAHFAAIIFHGVPYALDDEAKELHARVPAWVVRGFVTKALAHARWHTHGAVRCELAMVSSGGGSAPSSAPSPGAREVARGDMAGVRPYATPTAAPALLPPKEDAAPRRQPSRAGGSLGSSFKASATPATTPVSLLAVRVQYETGGVDLGLSSYAMDDDNCSGLVLQPAVSRADSGGGSVRSRTKRSSAARAALHAGNSSLPRVLRWLVPAAKRVAGLGGQVVFCQDESFKSATLELRLPVEVLPKAPAPPQQAVGAGCSAVEAASADPPSRASAPSPSGILRGVPMAVRRSLLHASFSHPRSPTGASVHPTGLTPVPLGLSKSRSEESDQPLGCASFNTSHTASSRASSLGAAFAIDERLVAAAQRAKETGGHGRGALMSGWRRASSMPQHNSEAAVLGHEASGCSVLTVIRSAARSRAGSIVCDGSSHVEKGSMPRRVSQLESLGESGSTPQGSPRQAPVHTLGLPELAPPLEPGAHASSGQHAITPTATSVQAGFPRTITGRDVAAAFRPVGAGDARARILVVLDNNLDPPAFDGKISGAEIARQLHEMRSEDMTVVMHTGASPSELHALLESGVADVVTVKDRAGRQHICELCAQHDLCVFVDDMPFVLFALQSAIERAAYGGASAGAPEAPPASTAWEGPAGEIEPPGAANLRMRYAMLSEQSDLELLFAICRRELTFDDNVMFLFR